MQYTKLIIMLVIIQEDLSIISDVLHLADVAFLVGFNNIKLTTRKQHFLRVTLIIIVQTSRLQIDRDTLKRSLTPFSEWKFKC